MTFHEWLEEKRELAHEEADESWLIAPNSYGTGFNKGYAAALEDIISEMPYRAAKSPMDRSPQDIETPHE